MKINKTKYEIAIANSCLTDVELSKKADISLQTIVKIKKGSSLIRPITVGKIARALNIPVEELIEE